MKTNTHTHTHTRSAYIITARPPLSVCRLRVSRRRLVYRHGKSVGGGGGSRGGVRGVCGGWSEFAVNRSQSFRRNIARVKCFFPPALPATAAAVATAAAIVRAVAKGETATTATVSIRAELQDFAAAAGREGVSAPARALPLRP